MKRLGALLALLLGLGAGGTILAGTIPSSAGFVSDYAHLFSPGGKAALENRLGQIQKDTGAEVAVVTIFSLEGETVEDYAVRLFNAWGIGQKDKDNGVLLIMALAERKVRIEVGYGLEPIITDGRAGRILDDEVLPAFRGGNYEQGLTRGAVAIEKYIRENAPPSPVEDNPFRGLDEDYIPIYTWIGVITIYLTSFMARSRDIWLGTIWGVVVGVFLGLIVGRTLSVVVLPFMAGGIGALLDYILSRNYRALASSGQPTSWWSSGGGFSGGGGRSSGGFSGGALRWRWRIPGLVGLRPNLC